MKKCMVIGGGIAGVLSARIMELLEREVILIEAGPRLGGCAGTFERNHLKYNIGATTIPSLIPDFPLKRLLDLVNNSPLELAEVHLINPPILIHNNGKTIARFMSPDEDLEEWQRAFPTLKGHKKFLNLSYQITNILLKSNFYLNNNSILTKTKTILKNMPIYLKIAPYFYKPASALIRELYGQEISDEFYYFLEAQVMITLQTSLKETSALGLLLAIGYPYTGVGKANGGTGKFIEAIALPTNFFLNEKVLKIKKFQNSFLIKTQNETYHADEIILAFPFLENLEIFEDNDFLKYFNKYRSLLSPYSAFVCYGKYMGSTIDPSPSHLIILPETMKNNYFSGYLFLSFLNHSNIRTFTLSTHVPISKLRDFYSSKDFCENLKKRFINYLCEIFGEKEENFTEVFYATPFTFRKYLNKIHLGGIPFKMENHPFKIPGNITPFKGLFLVGEHSFAYQGWLGISVGILNLYEHLRS